MIALDYKICLQIRRRIYFAVIIKARIIRARIIGSHPTTTDLDPSPSTTTSPQLASEQQYASTANILSKLNGGQNLAIPSPQALLSSRLRLSLPKLRPI
jgi:hypothetical protein